MPAGDTSSKTLMEDIGVANSLFYVHTRCLTVARRRDVTNYHNSSGRKQHEGLARVVAVFCTRGSPVRATRSPCFALEPFRVCMEDA